MLLLRRPPSLAAGLSLRRTEMPSRSDSASIARPRLRARAAADNAANADAPAPSAYKNTSAEEWEERRKRRLVVDLREAVASAHRRASSKGGRPGGKAAKPTSTPLPALEFATDERLWTGVTAIENLLPGWRIDLDAGGVPAWEVAALALDPQQAAARVLALKALWPTADLAAIVQKKPAVLLDDVATLKNNAKQVRRLLQTAKDADLLVTLIPELLSPRMALSILLTVTKWYFNRKDPVEVLENDPELISRASACDMALEPVFLTSDGGLEGPSLDYINKRTAWQKFIDTEVYKQPGGKGDIFASERIVSGGGSGIEGEGEGEKDVYVIGQGF